MVHCSFPFVLETEIPSASGNSQGFNPGAAVGSIQAFSYIVYILFYHGGNEKVIEAIKLERHLLRTTKR